MGSGVTITLPATGLGPRDYRELMGASPLALAVLDRTGRLVEANRAFTALLETVIGRLRDVPLAEIVHPADRALLIDLLDSVVSARVGRPGPASRSGTVTIRLIGESDRAIPVTAHLSATGAGDAAHVLVAAVDLRVPVGPPDQMTHAATHDPLTGLLNRTGLMAQLQALLDQGRPASLALLDLDVLVPIDQAYGHGVGDHLLRRVADALADLTSPDGLACRLAGDEFVVIADTEDELALAGFLTESLARLQVEVAPGVVLATEPSVGTSPVHAGLTPGQVLAQADESMYAVKRRRREALGVG